MDTDRMAARATSRSAMTVLAVAAGGVLGTAARYGVARVVPTVAGAVPWATLLVNLTGSLGLGLVVGLLTNRASAAPAWVRPLLATGLLGSYTTYSAFAVETNALFAVRPLLAAGYVLASVLGGVALAAVGLRMARR